jgi:hypothetical protein
MVTCYRCYERLPDRCTCPTTYRKKIAKWLKLVRREAQLIIEIHENNYNPIIEFRLYNGNKIVEKIVNSYQPREINNYNYEMVAKIFPKTKVNKLLAILYDTRNKPLYRHRNYMTIIPPDGVEYHWRIGLNCTEKDAYWSWKHYP